MNLKGLFVVRDDYTDSGEIRPRQHGSVDVLDLSTQASTVAKGDLLGWFNMGSTVIMLLPGNTCEWDADLQAGASVKVGEAIGQLAATGK